MIHQISQVTAYDRYPYLFGYVANKYNGMQPEVLSFGCSDCTEIRTLKELYMPNATYTGCDVVSGGQIITPEELYSNKQMFDVIFCMSVLCRFPDDGQYTFTMFEDEVIRITNKLKRGGLLVIYNSNFRISDTSVYDMYEVEDIYDVGHVPQYDREGNVCVYREVIFKKK